MSPFGCVALDRNGGREVEESSIMRRIVSQNEMAASFIYLHPLSCADPQTEPVRGKPFVCIFLAILSRGQWKELMSQSF